MRLVLLFLGTVAAVLALLMALTRWMDPFGQFYDAGVLSAAAAGREPCLISEDLVGSGSWASFKEQVYRVRSPRTIVVGTSRVLKMVSRTGERGFANLGIPGTGIETLDPLFRRLHEERPGPLTVYIGVELFWFNPSWEPRVAFGSSRLSDVRYLLARDSVTKSLSRVVHDRGFLWHRWERERIGRRCALDRGARVRDGERDAWAVDGSFVYRSEVLGVPIPPVFAAANPVDPHGYYYGGWHHFDRGRLRRLAAVLELARSYGWRVVGFSPPATSRYASVLAATAQTAPRLREFRALVPTVFGRAGFLFVDLGRAPVVPCAETAFYRDSWHAKQPCMDAVRRRLDKAAGRVSERVAPRP
jgi:hypothetical protein